MDSKNSFIAAAEFEKTVYVWDIKNGNKVCQFNSTYGYGGSRIAITSNGKYIVTGCYGSKGLALYNSLNGDIVWKRKDIKKVQKIKISPDDEYLYVSIDNNYLLGSTGFPVKTYLIFIV